MSADAARRLCDLVDQEVARAEERLRRLTVKEAAAVERVTERTVRRWVAKGAVRTHRTPGGGIRIDLSA